MFACPYCQRLFKSEQKCYHFKTPDRTDTYRESIPVESFNVKSLESDLEYMIGNSIAFGLNGKNRKKMMSSIIRLINICKHRGM